MAAEAFVVIRNAMNDKERVGLVRIVMANREHIIALEPLGKGILGTTLRYDYEVRDEEVPNPRVPKNARTCQAYSGNESGTFRSKKNQG
jgi:DNA end-binding protein Ku